MLSQFKNLSLLLMLSLACTESFAGELFSIRQVRKIDIAKKAMRNFVNDNHIDGFDRGCISTFSGRDSYTQVAQYGRSSEVDIIAKIGNIHPDSNTAFYDGSIRAVASADSENNDRDIPNIVVLITDGTDNASRSSSAEAAEYIRNIFDHKKNAFGFVIGVGTGENINAAELQRFSRAAFPSMGQQSFHHIVNMDELEATFKRILVQIRLAVQRQVAVGNHAGVNFVGISQQAGLQVQRSRMNYQFLLDISYSMDSTERSRVMQCPGRGLERCDNIMNFQQTRGHVLCDTCVNSVDGSKGIYFCAAHDIHICHTCEKQLIARENAQRAVVALIPTIAATMAGTMPQLQTIDRRELQARELARMVQQLSTSQDEVPKKTRWFGFRKR